jgi:hypothetical protein
LGGAGPERLLALVALEAEGDVRGRSLALLRFLLLHLAVRDAIRLIDGQGFARAVWALAFAACLLASFRAGWQRAAACAALAVVTCKGAIVFPDNSNHFLIEWLCILFASLTRFDSEAECSVFVRGARWLPVLVFFWSGVNKAVYGTYFNGAYLGSILGHSGFASVFGWLMSGEELATLLATPPRGPFAFHSPAALLASNGVWIGEIAAGIAILLPRWRSLGVAAGVLLLAGIQLGARELMFGMLMANLLACFAPVAWSRRLLPVAASVYAALLVVRTAGPATWSFN